MQPEPNDVLFGRGGKGIYVSNCFLLFITSCEEGLLMEQCDRKRERGQQQSKSESFTRRFDWVSKTSYPVTSRFT